jgi:hypothetical protein
LKLLILSDLHAEFETFELPQGLDFDVAILAGDIVAPGRVVARWLRNPVRFGNKPIVQIAGNHEYYESVLDQEEAEMRRQAEEQGVHLRFSTPAWWSKSEGRGIDGVAATCAHLRTATKTGGWPGWSCDSEASQRQ